jgi:hypothetical protein
MVKNSNILLENVGSHISNQRGIFERVEAGGRQILLDERRLKLYMSMCQLEKKWQ